MNASNDNAGTQERRTLWIVLLLNAAIAAGFFVSGAFADSSALIANGVDNLSDTAVYALSLVALTHGKTWKTRAAIASGVMLLIFAGGILIDVGRRYVQGSEPIGPTMMVMSAIAGVVNYLCLRLLQRLKDPLRPVADRLDLSSDAVARLATLTRDDQGRVATRFEEPGFLDDLRNVEGFVKCCFHDRGDPLRRLLRGRPMEPLLVKAVQDLDLPPD